MLAGAILDRTGSWPLALFVPSVFFFLTGIAVFAGLGTSDAQDFSDNGPFWCAAPADPRSLSGAPLCTRNVHHHTCCAQLRRDFRGTAGIDQEL